MSAQPATCTWCHQDIALSGERRKGVVLCPLHDQAEATAKERDALLAALEASDKDASALVEIIKQLPTPKDEADYEYIAETLSESFRIHKEARAAIAAARPKHATQEGEAG